MFITNQASLAAPTRGRIVDGQVNDSANKGRRAFVSRNRVIFDQDVVSPAAGLATARDLEKRFQKLATKWKAETIHLSSPHDTYLHPSYSQIIGMGMAAVPLILRSMQTEPYDWFFALRAISRENPVPAGAAGDVKRMTALWLAWGKRNGFI